MNKVYTIIEHTGSYDSYSFEVTGVTEDYEKGNEHVIKMNKISSSLVEKMKLFNTVVQPVWIAENPQPVNNIIKHPKWTSDMLITTEMRKERLEIEEKNNEITCEYSNLYKQWYEKYNDYKDNWMESNCTVEEIEMSKYEDNHRWSIEETVWL